MTATILYTSHWNTPNSSSSSDWCYQTPMVTRKTALFLTSSSSLLSVLLLMLPFQIHAPYCIYSIWRHSEWHHACITYSAEQCSIAIPKGPVMIVGLETLTLILTLQIVPISNSPGWSPQATPMDQKPTCACKHSSYKHKSELYVPWRVLLLANGILDSLCTSTTSVFHFSFIGLLSCAELWW